MNVFEVITLFASIVYISNNSSSNNLYNFKKRI